VVANGQCEQKCHLWLSDVDYRFGVVNVRRKEQERARTSWRQKTFTENIKHLLKLLTHLLKLYYFNTFTETLPHFTGKKKSFVHTRPIYFG
jgi:hypothetical protein